MEQTRYVAWWSQASPEAQGPVMRQFDSAWEALAFVSGWLRWVAQNPVRDRGISDLQVEELPS